MHFRELKHTVKAILKKLLEKLHVMNHTGAERFHTNSMTSIHLTDVTLSTRDLLCGQVFTCRRKHITHRLVWPVVLLEDVLSSILTAVRKQHDYFITVCSGDVCLLQKKIYIYITT